MGQRSSPAPDVADPAPRVSTRVCRRQHIRRKSLGQPLPLGPLPDPQLVVPALRFPLVGHCDKLMRKVGSWPCVSAWSSCPPTAGPRLGGSGNGPTAPASTRRGPTTTSDGPACPTGPGMPRCPCLPPRPPSPKRVRAGHARRHTELPSPRHARPATPSHSVT